MEGRRKVLSRLWAALPALILIIAVIALSAAIKGKADRLKAERAAAIKRGKPTVNVVLLEVRNEPIRDRLNLPAVVEPEVRLEVFAEVPGKIVEVAVSEGESVKKGALIARIDSRDYENAFDSTRADYELSLKNLERTEALYKEALVKESDYDRARTQVESLRAEMENARLRLERCAIKAPIDGTVNRLDAKEGLLLKTYDPVAVLLDIDPVKVRVGIPESDVDAVRNLAHFDVSFDALGGRRLKGKKVFLSKSPDPLAHLYGLDIEVENPGGDILPGMFARVDIVKRETKAISVPIYAVIKRDEGQFVYVEQEGRARAKAVETGILEGWRIQITRGLVPGDRVVVVGHRSLSEGQEVNIVRTASSSADLFK